MQEEKQDESRKMQHPGGFVEKRFDGGGRGQLCQRPSKLRSENWPLDFITGRSLGMLTRAV